MDRIHRIWPQWHTEELLGSGTFGKVYKIRRDDMGYPVYAAVKVIDIYTSDMEIMELKQEGLDEKAITAYFQKKLTGIVNETRVMESLKQANNIVRIEDCQIESLEFHSGWTLYIRMELLESLSSYIQSCTLSPVEIVNLGIDICEALKACEKQNIIHRDIKPENIFIVKQYGTFKLGDFGIAKYLEGTKTGMSIKGTYAYMAPELCRGDIPGKTIDIYSLGIMLYKLSNKGRLPFMPTVSDEITPESREQAIMRRIRGEKLPLPEGVDHTLGNIILKACEPAANNRYQCAAEFQQALFRWKNSGNNLQNSEQNSKIIPDSNRIKKSKNSTIIKTIVFLSMFILSLFLTFCFFLLHDGKSETIFQKQLKNEEFQTSVSAAKTETESQIPAKDPLSVEHILMSDECMDEFNGYSFGSNIKRDDILSITFMDSLDAMSENSWDVSANQNGEVMAWTVENGDKFDLYIGAEGGVTANPSCMKLFSFYHNVRSIRFNSAFTTSRVRNMRSMFYGCTNLTELDIDGIDTSAVTNMRSMFNRCSNLVELDLKAFDTSQVTDMSNMFNRCHKLKNLNISSFNTAKVNYMFNMFYECKHLKSLNVSGFNTAEVSYMGHMFAQCTNLEELDVSGFNTSKVVDMNGMFENCRKIKFLDVSRFNTSNVSNMSYMFYNCSSLADLDIDHFDMENVTEKGSMFTGTIFAN